MTVANGTILKRLCIVFPLASVLRPLAPNNKAVQSIALITFAVHATEMRRLFAPQDRLRLTNEDAVNALAFAPPRGAWSVEAHAHFPPALRKRCAKLLLLKPGHVPNVCWLRVLS